MKTFLFAILFFPLFPNSLEAAETYWDNAQKKELGRIVETSAITVSSITATALNTQSFRAVTTDIFNNSAYALWIGSNAATLGTMGFPILSSKTYTIDGLFTGVMYGLAESAAGGSINVRIIQYKMKSGD